MSGCSMRSGVDNVYYITVIESTDILSIYL